MTDTYPLKHPRRICVILAVHREDGLTLVIESSSSRSMGLGRGLTSVDLRFPDGRTRRAVAFGLKDDVIAIRDASDDIGPGTEVWEVWEN